MLSRYDLVLFDLDGILADSFNFFFRALNNLLNKYHF